MALRKRFSMMWNFGGKQALICVRRALVIVKTISHLNAIRLKKTKKTVALRRLFIMTFKLGLS